MGANSQLTLVLLNSCFFGPLFPAPKEAWYAGWSCNHIQGQLALPGSKSEVIPIDTAELSKLEVGVGGTTLNCTFIKCLSVSGQ